MLDFNKEHDLLICIDSDGTVIDSMNLKHMGVICPAFIEVFGINEYKEEIKNEWYRINLYSKTRGLNRFKTLLIILKYIESYGYTYDGFNEYESWVENTNNLSIVSLKEVLEKIENNYCLNLAYNWCLKINEDMKHLEEAKPFEKAISSINTIVNNADLVGISTANKEALYREWKKINIFDKCKAVYSQEFGTKKYVISNLLNKGYKNIILIGDSTGDLEAARSNDAWFYPIIPSKEDESWDTFVEDVYPKLLNDQFDLDYQNKLIQEFYNVLK